MRSLSWMVTFAICVFVAWFIWPHLKGAIPPSLQHSAFIGIFFTCTLPQFIFEIMNAKPFDITALRDSVNYEFTSNAYAIEFAMLNRHAEWVKIDGHDLIEK